MAGTALITDLSLILVNVANLPEITTVVLVFSHVIITKLSI